MTVVEPTNSIDGATVEGFEISYQSAFTNLPSPWDGFGVLLNYTYQDSDDRCRAHQQHRWGNR